MPWQTTFQAKIRLHVVPRQRVLDALAKVAERLTALSLP